MRTIIAALALLIALPAAAQNVTSVPALELDRYAGTWYEQASFPMFFQRKCASNTTANYTLRADKQVDVRNNCVTREGKTIQANGVARLQGKDPARLKVRFAPGYLAFLPFVWADYWVIGLEPNYRWAVVGTPNRKYLWILSRDQNLERTELEKAIAIARSQGFDTGKLSYTMQQPKQ